MTNIDTLPKWYPKFESCGKCDSFGFIVEEGKATKCSCKIEYDKKVAVLYRLLQANVISIESSQDYVESLLELSIDSYKGPDKNRIIPKMEKYINNFSERFSSLNLFFSGKPGTQKSTVAKAMVKALVSKNISCYYILANSLIEMIIDSGRNEEVKESLQEIIKTDFLVIDEFDEDKIITYASGWQRKNLFPWIKNRLELIKKSTLFISNKPIDELGKYFEEAIQDLILREVPDKSMIFEDKYYLYNGKIDISSIWDD